MKGALLKEVLGAAVMLRCPPPIVEKGGAMPSLAHVRDRVTSTSRIFNRCVPSTPLDAGVAWCLCRIVVPITLQLVLGVLWCPMVACVLVVLVVSYRALF